MYRFENDIFQPTPALNSGDLDNPGSLEPPPGPSALWTAAGVISALEHLALPDRAVRLREMVKARISSVTVVLDQPHDPHNGSAVLRSCDAFGVQRLHVLSGGAKFSASKLVAKGSQRWVDVIEHTDPHVLTTHLKRSGFTTLVTHPQGRLTPADLASMDRVAIVLGNERDGVSPELTAAADNTIKIPMRGFVESLNMSVTAAILIQAACSGRLGDLSEERQLNLYARWLRISVPRAEEVLSALAPC